MDVTIVTTEGRQFTIEVDFFDTIMEMKEKIQKYKNIPVSRQTLVYENQIMEDDRDTEFYKILQGAHIRLLIEPELRDPIATPNSERQNRTTISGSEPPKPQVHKPIAVRADSSTNNTKRLQVKVVSACGTHKILVEVNVLDKVGGLKEELQRLNQSINFPLPTDGFFFIHRQEVMEEDQSYHWHSVKQGDVIEVFPGYLTELEQ